MIKNKQLSPLNEAEEAIKFGLYDRAEYILKEILAKSPQNVGAKKLLGLLLSKKQLVFESISILEEVLSVSAHDFEVTMLLSQLYRAIDDMTQSLKYAQMAVDLRRDSAKALGWLGNLYAQQFELQKAVVLLQRSIAIDPLRWDSHFSLGSAYEKTGRYEDAIRCYELVYSKSETQCAALVKLITVYRCIGDGVREEEMVKRAENDLPDSLETLTELAHMLWSAELIDLAQKWTEKALELSPDNSELLGVLGAIYQRNGEFEKAIEVLSHAAETSKQPIKPLFELVFSKKMTPEDEGIVEQLKVLQSATKITVAERSQIHYALAKSYDDFKDYESAGKHYRIANQFQIEMLGSREKELSKSKDVDFAIKKFTPGFFDQYQHLASDSKKPIFIIGMIRSGTTLTEQIVSSHPDVFAGGEQRYMFQRVGTSFNQKSEFQEKMVAETRDGYLQLLAQIGKQSPRVTDKMPLNFELLGLIYLMFPNAKFIHTMRDPGDNALSIYVTPYSRPVNFAHDPNRIFQYYRDYIRLMDHWKSVIPANAIYHLQYEDLIQNRAEKTRELIDFLELPWNEACLHHEDNGRAILTPSTWQAKQPIYKTSIARWKKYEPYLPEFAEFANEFI